MSKARWAFKWADSIASLEEMTLGYSNVAFGV